MVRVYHFLYPLQWVLLGSVGLKNVSVFPAYSLNLSIGNNGTDPSCYVIWNIILFVQWVTRVKSQMRLEIVMVLIWDIAMYSLWVTPQYLIFRFLWQNTKSAIFMNRSWDNQVQNNWYHNCLSWILEYQDVGFSVLMFFMLYCEVLIIESRLWVFECWTKFGQKHHDTLNDPNWCHCKLICCHNDYN